MEGKEQVHSTLRRLFILNMIKGCHIASVTRADMRIGEERFLESERKQPIINAGKL